MNLARHTHDRAGPLIVSVSGLSVEEFGECFRRIEPLADGVEVNISTPNTEGVRMFLDPAVLAQLLRVIAAHRDKRKPIWVKIPPYYDEKERDHVLDLVDICVKWEVDGMTAINSKKVQEPRAAIGTGGLTGPLIFEDMLRIVSDVYRQTQGRIPIIACGGISSGLDVWRAFEVGASAVQIYTSFVYKGPGVVRRMNQKLLELLQSSKTETLNQITGTGLR
jgi:dihydroorotate dehydrogenase